MASWTDAELDATGKVSLDHIYDMPDPRPYFNTLRGLDYNIPQLAKPHFAELIGELRARHGRTVRVLDIGCSYGINAALLRCDATMDELYDRYRADDRPRAALIADDRDLVRSQAHGGDWFAGLDASAPALDYAVAAGFLDAAVHADLETNDPTDGQRALFDGTDLVVSTGCVGYVTDATLARVAGDRTPWMAHFVLRMFPFDPIAERLDALGYDTVVLDQGFPQRRFASADERDQVLDTLADAGVDPAGWESEGSLYARLHISRPRAKLRSVSAPAPLRTTVNEDWSTRTFGNEDRLPRVPLPTLEESCERFLQWCAPLLTAEEFAETESAVADFLRPDSPARALHSALEKYDAQEGVRSWLDRFWPARYLGRRDRIAVNANFFFLFEDSPLGQVERAVDLVAAAVDYKLALDTESVPPVVLRGQPQSMEQQKYLFSTTRIPGSAQDTVRAPYGPEWPGPSPARHIAVFFRGAAYSVDVLGVDGLPCSADNLAAALRAILASGVRPASPVGHLTTKARAEWAAGREALRDLPGNAASLDVIETALFCLCLEDFAPADTLAACDQLLHGDSGNRWFDKAVSLIVFADGRAGINVEHCRLDGTTILAFTDALLRPSVPRSSAFTSVPPTVTPVDFTIDEALRTDIAGAAESFATYAADTATLAVSFPDFGADAIKRLGMSPDAFVQMAYQLAHKRSKGLTGATYESIATRQFQNGRTEAMRVVTPAVLTFVAAMEDPTASSEARRDAFRTAATAHVTRAKECQAGHAPEQHLWELQWVQRRNDDSAAALALYESPGWLIMRDDYLSTSSAPSTTIQYFGFGSTSRQCIGVAYVLLPDRFNVYLSTPRPVAHEMTKFAAHLRDAVTELGALLAD